MKSIVPGLAAAAAVAASLWAAPCAALPMAGLSAVPVESPIHQARWRRHLHYRYPPLEVLPGLYYGCRPGWYCFGPPLRPWYSLGWYGGFNSKFGYQGARWRPPPRNVADK